MFLNLILNRSWGPKYEFKTILESYLLTIFRIQMGQRGIRAQHSSKSETRLLEIKRPPRSEPRPETSLSGARNRSPYSSRHRVPGGVINAYEERYESTEELEEWMRNQPLEMRKLNKHDRLIMKIAGGFDIRLFYVAKFWYGGWSFSLGRSGITGR